jgi:hypothetical protein
MKAKMFPESFQDVNLMDPANIYPCDAFVGRQSKRIQICDHLLLAPRTGIIEQSHAHGLGPLFADVNKRPW